MFCLYLLYLLGMTCIYAIVPVLMDNISLSEGVVKFYGVLNCVFLFMIIWWNARKQFYFVWGGYLVLLAAYYGLVYPSASGLLAALVITVAALNIVITFYDVVICRCKGIYSRTDERYVLKND